MCVTDLLRSIDDSGVVAKLQRADDGGAQREEQVAGDLLLLLREEGTRRRRQPGSKFRTRRKQGDQDGFSISAAISEIAAPRPDRVVTRHISNIRYSTDFVLRMLINTQPPPIINVGYCG